jgi:hypothetical protein
LSECLNGSHPIDHIIRVCDTELKNVLYSRLSALDMNAYNCPLFPQLSNSDLEGYGASFLSPDPFGPFYPFENINDTPLSRLAPGLHALRFVPANDFVSTASCGQGFFSSSSEPLSLCISPAELQVTSVNAAFQSYVVLSFTRGDFHSF